MMNESTEARNARLNAEAANAAHAEGRHGPGAVLEDRLFWARMGCEGCGSMPLVEAIAGAVQMEDHFAAPSVPEPLVSRDFMEPVVW